MKALSVAKIFVVLPLLHLYLVWGLALTDAALWVVVAGLALYYPVGQLGQSIGYHRLFAHRAFKPRAWYPYFAAFLSSISFAGDPLSYATVHRLHHRYADTDRDPHSPSRGRFHAYVGWIWRYSPTGRDVLVAADVLRDYPWTAKFRHVEPFVPVVFHAALAAISLEVSLAVLIACLLSIHVSFAINAFSHDPNGADFNKATDNVALARLVSPTFLHRHHHSHGGLADYSSNGVRDWSAPLIRHFLSRREETT